MTDLDKSIAPTPSTSDDKPTVLLCIGMAGSGKTTFMQRLNADLHAQSTPPYVINLDPAVHSLPYSPHLDIRDTVVYKEVMRQYRLGPNGAIMTSLNLFATKFDQVLDLLERRRGQDKFVLIDTPGQIEIFTWSASGTIITEALAASGYPTILVYLVDTPRSQQPATFMSNLLYACSIMYKTRLPLLVAFNKTDEESADRLIEWMRDSLEFQAAALNPAGDHEYEGTGSTNEYMNGLVQSMSLVLDEFYATLPVVAVSAFTGDGMEEFWEAVEKARCEYEKDYLPEIERRQRETSHSKDADLNRLMADLRVEAASTDQKSDLSNSSDKPNHQ